MNRSGSGEGRMVLHDVSWNLYQHMLAELWDRSNVRLAFESGSLEITRHSFEHERAKKTIARLIETYALHTGTDVQSYGSATLRRPDLQKGLDPDECYYVANISALPWGGGLVDLTNPPPDLSVEVELPPPLVNRMAIYGALGVREVWRFNCNRLTIHVRRPDGTYESALVSPSFPRLQMEPFNHFVQIGLSCHQPAALDAMMNWLRETGQTN